MILFIQGLIPNVYTCDADMHIPPRAALGKTIVRGRKGREGRLINIFYGKLYLFLTFLELCR